MKLNKKIVVLLLFVFTFVLVSGCSIMQSRKMNEVNNILRSGNEALRNNQYDKAIEFYDSGLAVLPEEPVFLSNKSLALRMRGIERYNASIHIADKKTQIDGIEISKNDFREAAVISAESINQIKIMSPVDTFILDSLENTKLNTFANHAETMRLYATIADKSKADQALEAAHNYLALETDQEKKLKAQLTTGKMLIDTSNGAKAVIEYQNILDIDPNQPDALFGMGLALSQSGQTDDFHKARPYLEKFINQTPENNPSVAVAKEILNTIPSRK